MNANTLTKVAHGLEIIAHALREEAKLANPNLQGAKAEKPATTNTEVKEDKKPAISMEVDVVNNGEEGYSAEELNEMTVKQLKELADENGVTYPDKVRKSDLIELIIEGANEAEPDEDEDAPAETVVEEETSETSETVEDAESEELTIGDIVDMNLKELKDLAKEYEIDHAKNIKTDDLMELVINELFDEDEIEAYNAEQEDVSEVDEAPELTEEDLDAMNLTELKALADEHEITYAKVVKPATLREKLRTELFADDDSDETALDENDRAKELGLDEMSVEDLAELLVEHKLDAKGKKQALIARVLDAIDEGIIEVEEDEGK